MVQIAAASSRVAGRIETSPMTSVLLFRSVSRGDAIREIDCSHANDEEYCAMDLNPAHVRTLREIARHGSFSRAAESLHLSQPAVSLHMRQLEARCGTALLERVGKRAFPTAAGAGLLGHAGPGFAGVGAGPAG